MTSPVSRTVSLLTILLPKENDRGPIVMEQVLAAIHGLNTVVSLEWWSYRKQIRLLVRCAGKHKDFVIHQLETHYPGIDIREETEDMAEKPADPVIAHLSLSIVPIFPIRRYSQSADKINRVWTDPSLGILSALRKASRRETRGIQIIFSPAPAGWRKTGIDTLTVYDSLSAWWVFERWWWLKNTFFSLVYRCWLVRIVFLFLFPKKTGRPPTENPEKMDYRGHERETVSEAARSKLSQIGFSVTIRLICSKASDEPERVLQEMAGGFAPFTIAELNGLILSPVSRHAGKNRRDMLRRTPYASMILSLEELAGMLALPTRAVEVPELARVPFRIVRAKADCGGKPGIVFGRPVNARNGDAIRVPVRTVRRHIAIIGKTGSGKSALMRHLFNQIVKTRQGVGLFDPHGDLAESLLPSVPEKWIPKTAWLDPADAGYPVAFNVLKGSYGRKSQLIASVVDVFQTLFQNSWGPRTDYILSHAVAVLAEVPGASLLGIPKLLLDSAYRKKCLKSLHDPLLMEFWEKEYRQMPARLRIESIAPLLNKVNRFLMVPMIRNMLGQQENRLDLRRIMDGEEVFLVNLAKGMMGAENSRLLGNFLLAHLQLAAFSRADTPYSERKPFTLFIDELHHFATANTEHLSALLAEGRKYRINLVLACQHLAQLGSLTDSIFGNVGTLVVFNVGPEDAKKIGAYLGSEVDPTDLLNLPPHHGYLRTIHGGSPQVVSFRNALEPLPTAGDGSSKARIVNHTRVRYARPSAEVEREIARFFDPEFPIP